MHEIMDSTELQECADRKDFVDGNPLVPATVAIVSATYEASASVVYALEQMTDGLTSMNAQLFDLLVEDETWDAATAGPRKEYYSDRAALHRLVRHFGEGEMVEAVRNIAQESHGEGTITKEAARRIVRKR